MSHGLYEDRGRGAPVQPIPHVAEHSQEPRIVRGVYRSDNGSIVGFFMNGVPAFIERAKDPYDAAMGRSVISRTVRHTFYGVYPQREPEPDPLDRGDLIGELADQLRIDRESIDTLLDSAPVERLGWNEGVSRAMVSILNRRTPSDQDLNRLKTAGWGYVEFDASAGPVSEERS